MKDGKKRGAMRLMEALSGVDEDLLERCGRERGSRIHRGLWQRNMRAAAAVLCLAVVGAVSWGGYQLANLKMGSSDSSGGAGGPFAEENREEALDAAAEEAAPQEMPENAVSDGQAQDAGADQSPEQEKAWKEGTEGMAGEAGGGMASDLGEADGNLQGAGGEEKAAGEEGAATTENGNPEGDVDTCLPPLQSQKLTLAQAREDDVLGAYVPTALPVGYAFEEAYCVTERDEENLTVRWARGMDSITLHLERKGNAPATVDVEKTESYDQRLYEVPYGETVPRQYRQTFDNPVFAAEDFSLEIVESRMKSYDDQGDTDTPRGNFGVLYPDGVLVRFSGRGTAEEIWEMFSSMGGDR